MEAVLLPRNTPLIMACHLTGVYDVNRSTNLAADDYSLVKDWAESIADLQLKGVLFHNNFSAATCAKHQNDYIQLVKVDFPGPYNPNVYRYFVYCEFLRQHAAQISHVFVTDVADVVVCSNPFIHPLFNTHPATLFCGDEPKQLDDAWMMDHSTHLRSRIADFTAYETQFSQATLLNCGVIGGNHALMQHFLEALCQIHAQYNQDNQSAYTGDMGAFNYLVRTRFNDCLYHGAPVNTVFKGYEVERRDCWFRHK